MFSQLKKMALLVILGWANSVSPHSVAAQDRMREIDNHISHEGSLRSIDQRLHSLEVQVKAIDQYLKNEFETLKQYLSEDTSKPKAQPTGTRQNPDILQSGTTSSLPKIPQLTETQEHLESVQPRATSSLPDSQCPPGFEFLPDSNSCYQIVFERQTWNGAKRKCQQMHSGAYPAVISSSTDQKAVEAYIQSKAKHSRSSICNAYYGKSVWLSGHRSTLNCSSDFFWMPTTDTTIPLSYTNWVPGEPNCFEGLPEHCMVMRLDQNYGWNDVSCNAQMCFLCEFGSL